MAVDIARRFGAELVLLRPPCSWRSAGRLSPRRRSAPAISRTARLPTKSSTGAKVKNNSLTGTELDEKALNQVPAANHANSADTANRAITAVTANNVMSAVVGKGAQGCTLLRATQPGTSAEVATGHQGTPKASACSVAFPRDVTQCTYVAGIGENHAGEWPGSRPPLRPSE